jgi:hypothetical protein
MNTTAVFLRSLACLAAVVVLAIGSPAAQGTSKRIVIIAGRPSHPPGMHEFRAGCLLLQKGLSGIPGITVDVYDNGWPSKEEAGVRVDNDAALENADAILIYADGGRGHPAIQKDRLALLEGYARKGVGLGFAHYAVEVPVGEPGDAMQRWIGGFYETNYSVNPMWTPKFEKLPPHPVTRGVEPFGNYDEWYFSMRWPADQAMASRITPLLVSTPSDDVRDGPYVSPRGPYPHIVADNGKQETMMWVYERPDGGRGFGFTGGHTHANWGDANQRKAVLNALLWIAKAEVPAGGVVDTITAADLTQNLDDKKKR